MLNIDDPVLAMCLPILIVFVVPFIYSFIVDRYWKENKAAWKKANGEH